MAVNFDARDLGKAIGKMSQEQARIQENIYPDDPDAQLLLQFPASVTVSGSIIGAAFYYPTNSFIVDHVVYGYVDSSTLLIDGSYSTTLGLSVAPAASSSLVPTSAANYFVQAITPSVDLWVTGANVLMNKTGSPSGNVVISICSLSSGNVTTTVVAAQASATLAASAISGSAAYSVTFSPPAFRLISGVGYTVNLTPVYTDGSNYTTFFQTTPSVYSGGSKYFSLNSGSTWTAVPGVDIAVDLLCSSASLLFSTTL